MKSVLEHWLKRAFGGLEDIQRDVSLHLYLCDSKINFVALLLHDFEQIYVVLPWSIAGKFLRSLWDHPPRLARFSCWTNGLIPVPCLGIVAVVVGDFRWQWLTGRRSDGVPKSGEIPHPMQSSFLLK